MIAPGIEKLTKDNFLLYAIKAYDNHQCMSMSEFQEDLKKIKYIKRLINRFLKTGELKERLILNHLIVLGNMFGPEHTTRILFFRLEKRYFSVIKTFLVYLNYMPDRIIGLEGGDIISDQIPINNDVADILKKL
jgi:hypothetical protein